MTDVLPSILTQRNLPNRRTLGKQNPYCIARVAHEAKSSPPDIRGGQIPKWDHEVRFNLRDSSDQKSLKLTILDKNDSKPELIGDTTVDLNPVFESNPRDGFDQWHELTYKGKYAGEVYLEMTFYPTKPNIPPKVVRKKKKKSSKKSTDPLAVSTMSTMSSMTIPADLPAGIVPAGSGSYRDPRAFDQYVPASYGGHASVSGLPALPNQSLPNHSVPSLPSQAMGHSVYGAGAGTPPPMNHSMNHPMNHSVYGSGAMSASMHSLGHPPPHSGHGRPLPEAVPERTLPDPRMSDPRMRSPGPSALPAVPPTPSPYREPLSHSRSADPIRRQVYSPSPGPGHNPGPNPGLGPGPIPGPGPAAYATGSPLRPSSAGRYDHEANGYDRPSSAGYDRPAPGRQDIPEPLRQSAHGRRSWGAGDNFNNYNNDRTAPLRLNKSQTHTHDLDDLTVSMLKNSWGGRSVAPKPPQSYERDRAYDRGYEPNTVAGETSYSPRGSGGLPPPAGYSPQTSANSQPAGYSPRNSANSYTTNSLDNSTNTAYTAYSDDEENQYKRFLNHKAPALDLPTIPTSPAQGQYGFSVKRKPVGSGPVVSDNTGPPGDVLSYAMQRKMASMSLDDGAEIPFSPDSYSKPNTQQPSTHKDNPNGLSGDDILDVSTYAPEPTRGSTRSLPMLPPGSVDPGNTGYKGEGQWDISDQLNAKYSDSVFNAVTQRKKMVRPPPAPEMYRKPQLPPKIPLGMSRDEYQVSEPHFDGYRGY